MYDLARKYRPNRLSDVLGQRKAVAFVRDQVSTQEGRSVLLSGPVGTGKTSLAYLYGKGIMCASPIDGCGCAECCYCLDFDRRGLASDVTIFQCGEQSTIADFQNLLTIARVAPNAAPRRVIILDELQNASARAMDSLLAIAERPPALLTLILLTSHIQRIPISLQSRLKHIELELLNESTAQKFLAQVCDREGVAYEPGAVSLLANAIPGAPRLLLRALEKVVASGPLTERAVRDELNLDVVGYLESFFAALLNDNIPLQFEALDRWTELPDRKLQLVQRYLAFVYFDKFLKLRREDPLLRGCDSVLTSNLCQRVLHCSERLRVSTHDIWQGLLECVTGSSELSDAKLATVALKLNKMLAVGGGEERSTENRIRKPRKIFYKSKDASSFLSWSNVRGVWNTASFMTQHYGELFNVRFALRGANPAVVVAETSELTRQLHMRLKEWSYKPDVTFHWMWQLEEFENGFAVRMALSINDQFVLAARNWIDTCFLKKSRRSASISVSWRARNAREGAIAFHWRAVRSLVRGLDPDLAVQGPQGRPIPLVTLLGIPRAWHAPLVHQKRRKQRGQSHSLGHSRLKLAQAENMRFLSAIDDCAWTAADTGWELEEFRDRVLEAKERNQASAKIEQTFADQNAFSKARMAEEIVAHQARCPKLAQDRRRSWRGWWLKPKSSCIRVIAISELKT